MAIFNAPPPAPQRGDRATFSSRMDAFLTWLVALIPQLDSYFGALTALTAGGANTFNYRFDINTANSDPAPGTLRLGSTTQNTSVVLRLDAVDGGGVDVTPFLNAMQGGTSNIKGSVRLQKVNDVGRWMLLDVSDIALTGGYANLTVSVRASSMANPFAHNDQIVTFFDRKGDKGDSGGTPTQADIVAAVGTLGIDHGGTGATTAEGARQAIGAMQAGTVAVKSGGTGATTAAGALNNLGAMPKSGGSFNGEVSAPGLYSQAATPSDKNQGGRLYLHRGSDNTATHYIQVFGSGSNPEFRLVSLNNTLAMSVSGAGNVTATTFAATSDERLKENWRALPDNFLEQFAAIDRAGLFDWSETGATDAGIGAQSIQRIAPWCVTESNGHLRVNHAALNTAVNHALARRLLRLEASK